MRGDVDNTQWVCLDGSPSARSRVIYSVRRLPEQRLQFGTVKVDYGTVAVWRPYDATDTGPEAPWRSVPWRNVYRVHVPQHPLPDRPGRIAYTLDEVEIGGLRATLPTAELDLNYHLKEHLRKL